MAVLVPLLPAFRPKELAIPLDFTVVLEENLVEPNKPLTTEPDANKTPPAHTSEPEPVPDDVPPPVPLPAPIKDAIVLDKKEKPKPPPKAKPEVKPPPKIEEKKEFKKGPKVTRPAAPRPPKFEDIYKPYDASKPISVKPVTDKMLSRAEIDKALLAGAREGTRNQIPEDEVSRCVVLVRRAMYEAWDQPGASDAGSRPALLDIRLDSAGHVVSYRIRQTSGSASFDQTVLKAAANAPPIRGLSLSFLKQYETLTIEFKLE
jgi:TonB family protein